MVSYTERLLARGVLEMAMVDQMTLILRMRVVDIPLPVLFGLVFNLSSE
jgi:hypothetical protein